MNDFVTASFELISRKSHSIQFSLPTIFFFVKMYILILKNFSQFLRILALKMYIIGWFGFFINHISLIFLTLPLFFFNNIPLVFFLFINYYKKPGNPNYSYNTIHMIKKSSFLQIYLKCYKICITAEITPLFSLLLWSDLSSVTLIIYGYWDKYKIKHALTSKYFHKIHLCIRPHITNHALKHFPCSVGTWRLDYFI